MHDIRAEYEEFLNFDAGCVAQARASLRMFAFLRLVSFVGIVLSLFWLTGISQIAGWCAAALSLVMFLCFIWLHARKEKEKIFHERLATINSNELLALDEVYTPFDGGGEFIDPAHDFSFDMDMFGDNSLFGILNRTVTNGGKQKLAGWFKAPDSNVEAIMMKQQAAEELAASVRWRQYFAATLGTTDTDQKKSAVQILQEYEGLKNRRRMMITVVMCSATCLSLLFLAILTIVPWPAFFISYCVNIAVITFHRRSISSCYEPLGKLTAALGYYHELFRLVEQKEFSTELPNVLRAALFQEGQSASAVIRELQKILSRFDYRMNILFAVTVNFIFMWELVCLLQLEKWRLKHSAHVDKWFNAIYETDALCSIANLSHNQPRWALPSLVNGEFHLSADDLGHPLVKADKRIGSDLQMSGEGKIIIITGANMAGKSTFLRTVGVNMILAMNGCRVCATSFTLKPVRLFTSIRITDNLGKDESYFYAELLRLQKMLSLIVQGIPLFIMIDEMLRGTNSEDKLTGSKALTEKLIHLNANGLIATHDLKLTSMSQAFPGKIINMCFEVHPGENDLLYDYKLRDGVTQTMNATYLMKKMGLI